mgnify:CR=1 FL=1
MLCPKCHNRIVKGSSFCHICGEPIPQQKAEKTILSRVKQKEEIKKRKKVKKWKIRCNHLLFNYHNSRIVGIHLFLNMNEPSYSSDNIVSQQVEKALHIDKDKVTLEIGESTTIKANLKCTYTVQDASICKINQEGTITALAAGKTKIFCISESGKKETVKVTVNKKEETIDEEDFVFPLSDTELLTEEDLQGKDQQQLRMGINEIYARHHCTFKTEEVKNYFEAKKWYSGDENLTSDLMNEHMSEYFNEVELKNISFIQAHR